MLKYIKFKDNNINLEKHFIQHTGYSFFADLLEKNYILSYSFYNEILQKTIQADLYQIKKATKTSEGYLSLQFSIDNFCVPHLITKFPSITHISTTIKKIVDDNLAFNKAVVHKIFERIFNWRINKEFYLQNKQYHIINNKRCMNYKFYKPDIILEYKFNKDNVNIIDHLSGDTYYYKIEKQEDDFFNRPEFVELMLYIETLFAFYSYDIYYDDFKQKIFNLYLNIKEKYPLLQIGLIQEKFNIYALLNTQEDFKLLLDEGPRTYTNIKIYFTHPEHKFIINTIKANEKMKFKTLINY